MKLKQKYYGKVTQGKLSLETPVQFKKYVEGLEGEVEIVVDRRKKNRSLQENAYYWAVIVSILSDEFGYTKEETHEALKWHFLRRGNEKLPTIQSTSLLTTITFEEYCKSIREWASAEMNIYIPEPNEPITDMFYV